MEIWWCESHESGIADMGPPDTPQDSVCWTFHHESNIACQLVERRLVSVDALVIPRDTDRNWPLALVDLISEYGDPFSIQEVIEAFAEASQVGEPGT